MVALLIAALLFLVYLPVVTTSYLGHDEYFLTVPSEFVAMFGYDQVSWMVRIGRPVGAITHWLAGHLTGAFADMSTLRAVNIALVAGSATLLATWLMRFGYGRIEAVLIGAMTGTLVPFQVSAGYGSLTYQALGFFLAAVASRAFFHALEIPARARRGAWLGVAGLALFMSLGSYQPMAFAIFAFALVPVLELPDTHTRARIVLVLRVLAFVVAVTAAYYGVWRVIIRFYPPLPQSYDPSQFVTDPLGRLQWFVQYPLRDCLKPWDPFARGWVAVLSLAIVMTGPLGDLFVERGRRAGERAGIMLAKYGLVAVLVPATFGIVLLSPAPYPTHRYQAPLAVAILVLGVSALGRMRAWPWPSARRAFVMVLMALTTIAAVSANAAVTNYYVLPHSMEIRYVKQMILAHVARAGVPHAIHVFPADRSRSFSDVVKYDEFGLTSSYLPYDVPGVVRWALRELGLPADISITIEPTPGRPLSFAPPSPFAQAPREPEQTFMLDLRGIRLGRRAGQP